MVAWKMTLYTPEYPAGRHIVCIANDITCNIGSFGPDEDILYQRASELARREVICLAQSACDLVIIICVMLQGIPRIYISANSGARLGLAEEVRSLFRIAWKDSDQIYKGIDYLYLTPHDYKKVRIFEVLETF